MFCLSFPKVFSSKRSLIEHKKRIDDQLRLLREQMKNLQEIKLYLKRVRPDKDDEKKTTKETHICRCEGGLSFTSSSDNFLADEPGDNTEGEVVYEDAGAVLEEEEEERRKKDKKKKDKGDKKRNRQKRYAQKKQGQDCPLWNPLLLSPFNPYPKNKQ